ncbi:hypothetical protein V6N11_059217 [Hibiscus sabdariffa]|uniref:Cytochrome P450 n=1 Tax=Hibiscus sabdariffa TaxID=183260 RepID=A0ABR2U6J5_9ROSI
MTPAVIASVGIVLEKWKGQEGKEIELFGEFRILTSEVISRATFSSNYLEGDEISALKREDIVVNGEIDKFGNDYLGLLVSAYRDSDMKNKLSLEDLVDECKTFYFAGQETVTSLFAWIIFLLAVHGDWKEKARREQLVEVQDPARLEGRRLAGYAKDKQPIQALSEPRISSAPFHVVVKPGNASSKAAGSSNEQRISTEHSQATLIVEEGQDLRMHTGGDIVSASGEKLGRSIVCDESPATQLGPVTKQSLVKQSVSSE